MQETQRQAQHLPVEQSMVQMFTEPLQDLVMVSDGWRLIFTGSKVALQLQRRETMDETPQQRRQLDMLTLTYSINIFSPSLSLQ